MQGVDDNTTDAVIRPHGQSRLIKTHLVLIGSIQVVILFPFININRLQKVASFWIIAILKILKLICGVSWKVKGLGNIKDQPCILVSNHQGVWESFFIQTLAIPSFSILKKELLYIPIFGLAVSCLNPIYKEI